MRPRYLKSCFQLTSVVALLFGFSALAASPGDTPLGVKEGSVPVPTVSSDVPARATTASSRPSVPSFPEPRLSGYELLLRGREASSRVYRELSSVVCHERIDRFKGPIADANGHPVDVIMSDVAMEEGTERYSNIRQNDKPRPEHFSHRGCLVGGRVFDASATNCGDTRFRRNHQDRA